ncbi:OmpH family outer membrane protein [Azospirillum halopraeferens]|uniref:OmpH family outer membrane protein n=1 Tax=Azospirillum halopraeferens TaxID=34010 RepID=UPI0004212AEA|nr:OmpH family outer membrane protein [Azospirillum halopraeferens]
MQFKKTPALLGAVAMAAALAFTAPVGAQTAPAAGAALPAPVIGVLDVQKILQESSAAKGIQGAVETQRDTYQKEISSLEEKLRTAEAELRKQQTVLAPDAFAAKRRDFEKQVADVQRTVQARKRALDTALNEAMGQVQKSMYQIMMDIAGNRGINVVLPKQSVLIFEPKLDLTEEVLGKLNETLPKVAVSIPKQ